MPELPEVEIAKRTLSKHILFKKIKDVTIINPKLRYNLEKKKLKLLKNKIINKIKRRSKYILIFFDDEFVMLIHLGMTGRFYFSKTNKNKIDTSFYNKNKIIHNHDHLKISFNGFDLIYNDIRKFGFIKILNQNELNKSKYLIKLGCEPLSNQLTFKYLKLKLSKKKSSVKNLLMNQKIISGLGNIYVNEVLHLSKIKPSKPGNDLKADHIKTLIKSIKKILKNAIKAGGSTISNYYNSEGKMGSYQANFKVYNMEGKICPRTGCDGKIQREFHSGRSIFFCFKCQS